MGKLLTKANQTAKHGPSVSQAPSSSDPRKQTDTSACELPSLTPEWEAYRSHVLALAADTSGPFATGDPRSTVPEALRPGDHKVHHAYIWLGSLSVIAAIVVSAIASSMQGLMHAATALSQSSDGVLATFILFGGIALCVLLIGGIVIWIQWVSWKNLHYQLAPTEFNLRSGILSKKHLHLPYQRVQAVNQQAGVLQRILGLCNIKIDTAGGSSNEAVTLRYIRNTDAEALRLELFRRKKVLLAGGSIDEWGNAFVQETALPSEWMTACCNGDSRAAATILRGFHSCDHTPNAITPNATTTVADNATNALDALDDMLTDVRGVFGGGEVATGHVSFETGLSNKELLLAGASKAGGTLGVMLVGALGVLGTAMGALENALDAWTEEAAEETFSAALATSDIAGSLLSGALLSTVGFIVATVAGLWIISALTTIVRFGGFKARRRESRIEVEHGLLQRTFHGVDIDRVQSVIIKQSFIRRCIGYCEVQLGKIDSTAQGEKNDAQVATQGIVVHPFIKTSRVPELLEGLTPELACIPKETIKPAPVALRRAIVRTGVIRSTTFWMALPASLGLLTLLFCERAGMLPVTSPDALFAISVLRIALWALIALFAIMFTVNAADAVLWRRQSGMGYDRQSLSITNGGLSSRTVVIPRKKIQFAYTKTNPFQRAAGVQTAYVRTAAGVSGTTEALWDIANEDAETWMDWARPKGNA